MNFTKDTLIGDVLDRCPEAAPLFLEIGMHCLGCPSARARPLSRRAMCTATTRTRWWRS